MHDLAITGKTDASLADQDGSHLAVWTHAQVLNQVAESGTRHRDCNEFIVCYPIHTYP
jgi:hypothetical protein